MKEERPLVAAFHSDCWKGIVFQKDAVREVEFESGVRRFVGSKQIVGDI